MAAAVEWNWPTSDSRRHMPPKHRHSQASPLGVAFPGIGVRRSILPLDGRRSKHYIERFYLAKLRPQG